MRSPHTLSSLSAWRDFNKANLRARELVSQTVDQRYKHCLSPLESLRKWIINLREQCAQTPEEIRTEARKEYRQVVDMKDTQMKKEGMEQWLSQWEKAMANGIYRGVAETLDPSAWIVDFISATRRVFPE